PPRVVIPFQARHKIGPAGAGPGRPILMRRGPGPAAAARPRRPPPTASTGSCGCPWRRGLPSQSLRGHPAKRCGAAAGWNRGRFWSALVKEGINRRGVEHVLQQATHHDGDAAALDETIENSTEEHGSFLAKFVVSSRRKPV